MDRATSSPGTYIANVLTSPIDTLKKTVISFDNGGYWRPLTPPTVDSDNQPIVCEGCSLHLHGITSFITGGPPPFYSSENAIGLILAVGNVGQTLDDDVLNLNTYLSRDGGLTWRDIFAGSTIYEFGDHGGILVFARTDILTNTIYYSLDEGLTILSFNYSITPQSVINIFSEFGGTSVNFLLYTEDSSHNFHWYGLNFTNAQPRLCVDSDYELWAPSDGEHGSNACVLGHTTFYSRRKQDAQCYNNRETEHLVEVQPCACTFADYECDIGFDASPRNATYGFACSASDPSKWPPKDPPDYCVPGTDYAIPTGYILVHGDVCKGGLDLSPKFKPCPTSTSSTTGSKEPVQPEENGSSTIKTVAIALAVIVSAGVVGAVGFTLWRKPELREQILEKIKVPSPYRKVSMIDDTDEPIGENDDEDLP